jgi:5-formyltetrahydrofolate cyclo-ligase
MASHPQISKWRRSERQRLIAARAALSPSDLEARRLRIDRFLELSFPGLANSRLAFCWPIKGEYDGRHFARTLRDKGALTALPVVVAPRTPLIFREWHPGIELAHGPLDIPYPVGSREVAPEAACYCR